MSSWSDTWRPPRSSSWPGTCTSRSWHSLQDQRVSTLTLGVVNRSAPPEVMFLSGVVPMPSTTGTWEQDEVMPVAAKTSVSLMDGTPEERREAELLERDGMEEKAEPSFAAASNAYTMQQSHSLHESLCWAPQPPSHRATTGDGHFTTRMKRLASGSSSSGRILLTGCSG